MMRNLRRIEECIFKICSAGAAFFAAGMLMLIIIIIGLYAIPSLTPYFLLTPESATPHIGMGIANAIVGSFLIAILATILATPLAIGTAIYLQRYAKESAITRAARFFIEVLAGTPSVVIGIFGLLVLVYYLKPITGGFSLIAGAVALAILIIPVIERSIEEAICTVPRETEEGSYALGANKWQTIREITLPIAMPGLITGIIFGFGRAAEESAVVILTAGYSQFMPEFTIKANDNLLGGIKIYPFQDVIGTLPYSVYHAYENSNVVKLSNGFAAAFVLICIVLCVNLSAKLILSRTLTGGNNNTANHQRSGFTVLLKQLQSKLSLFRKNKKREFQIRQDSHQVLISPLDKFNQISISSAVPGNADFPEKKSFTARIKSILPKRVPKRRPSPEQSSGTAAPVPDRKPAIQKSSSMRIFLRAFFPFAIPAIILLLVALIAGIPPLHGALGPVSTGSAHLFAIILSILVSVAGIVFALMVAKKGGAFRTKSRRAGLAGVAGGIILVCIAGLVCSQAATGFFKSGESATTTGDRNTQYAALLASGQLGDEEPVPAATNAVMPTVAGATPAMGAGSLPASSPAAQPAVPVKSALDLGESYWYGDDFRPCFATIYKVTILPFYFWWFIDYNRFVQEIPPAGHTYVVVFIRIEDTGNQSALVPSADQYNLTYRDQSYGHKAFFNKSVLSDWQIQYYSSHLGDLPYQWIREIGQEQRDYGYLTGYNIFGVNWTTTDNSTVNGENTSYIPSFDVNGKGYFIKPGSSNAIDGYLIYEVPDSVAADLKNAYVQVAFNSISSTRWRLAK